MGRGCHEARILTRNKVRRGEVRRRKMKRVRRPREDCEDAVRS